MASRICIGQFQTHATALGSLLRYPLLGQGNPSMGRRRAGLLFSDLVTAAPDRALALPLLTFHGHVNC
jgi:hypothetical protein